MNYNPSFEYMDGKKAFEAEYELPCDFGPARTTGRAAFYLIATLLLPTSSFLYFVFWQNGRQSYISEILLALNIILFAFLTQSLIRNKPWLPRLSIRREGVICHVLSSKIIPWHDIATIQTFQLRKQPSLVRVDILLRDDADAALKKRATTRSALLSHAPGKPMIGIFVGDMNGLEYGEFASILAACQRRGTQTQSAGGNVVCLQSYRQGGRQPGGPLRKIP